MATSRLEMACPTASSQSLCTIPSVWHVSLPTLPPPQTTSRAKMVSGKFISATTLSLMTRHHGTGIAELPKTLLLQRSGPMGMQCIATNHAVMDTPHTVLAAIPDVMAAFPQWMSMAVDITYEMATGTSSVRLPIYGRTVVEFCLLIVRVSLCDFLYIVCVSKLISTLNLLLCVNCGKE